MKPIDLIGRRFGRVVVMKRVANSKSGKCQFLYRCDCGTKKETLSSHLLTGKVKSCGCFRVDFGREIGLRGTHHLSNTAEYAVWANMKDRCYNKNNKSYRRYGGRGIRVCKRWRNSFQAFLEDMGMKPAPQFSIERLRNNGNYEPDNCEWGTRSQQQQNKAPFKHAPK
jgi:hypothetical protein